MSYLLYIFFHHIHIRHKFSRGKTFQFVNYHIFCRVYPVLEFCIWFIRLGEFQQLTQIKIIIDNTGRTFHGIESITLLLYVCRYHHQRFAQVHSLAYRLKTCSAGIRLATCHLTQKLDIVQLIKAQRVINFPDRHFIPSVPEKAQMN